MGWLSRGHCASERRHGRLGRLGLDFRVSGMHAACRGSHRFVCLRLLLWKGFHIGVLRGLSDGAAGAC